MNITLKSNKMMLQPLTKSELITIEGGLVSPWQIVQAAILIGGALYGVGYAGGKALYHATH